jgi:hypothetical protein
MSARTTARARVAALTRSRADDDPDLVDARRDLRAAGAEEYIAELLRGAPPLSDEQRCGLAAILRPSRVDGAA